MQIPRLSLCKYRLATRPSTLRKQYILTFGLQDQAYRAALYPSVWFIGCVKFEINFDDRKPKIASHYYEVYALMIFRAGNPISSILLRSTTYFKNLLVNDNLRAVVEVVPMVASANPVIVGGGVVGLVVGVSRRVVQLASLGVLAGGLGIESSSGLAVQGLEHLQSQKQQLIKDLRRRGTTWKNIGFSVSNAKHQASKTI